MNNTCIVTGATSGIGRATSIEISRKNTFKTLALIGRDQEELDRTALMMGHTCDCRTYPFDLNDLEAIPKLIDKIYEQCGDIDALLNIAGYTDPQALLTTELDSFEETFRINVFAPFMLIRSCVKYMKSARGRKILNVASTAGMTPRPGWLSYASSKAAVISMSETLAEELAEYGILVYCISPGRCATPLRRKLAPEEDPSTIMQPQSVARIIARLLEEDDNCLDGQNIVIRKRCSASGGGKVNTFAA